MAHTASAVAVVVLNGVVVFVLTPAVVHIFSDGFRDEENADRPTTTGSRSCDIDEKVIQGLKIMEASG